jgi:hypothetical protein
MPKSQSLESSMNIYQRDDNKGERERFPQKGSSDIETLRNISGDFLGWLIVTACSGADNAFVIHTLPILERITDESQCKNANWTFNVHSKFSECQGRNVTSHNEAERHRHGEIFAENKLKFTACAGDGRVISVTRVTAYHLVAGNALETLRLRFASH